jgi:hypothetical protein
LNVSPPADIQTSAALQNQSGAEAIFANGKSQFTLALIRQSQGLFAQSGLLADEYAENSYLSNNSRSGSDARRTTDASNGGHGQPGDPAFGNLMSARATLLLAENGLAQYEPESLRQSIGETFALIGYAELFLAEDYCAGVPLDRILPGGGVEYGVPLTTDSLLGVAQAHFDSAMAHANGDTTVMMLASVGLGRAQLDRGHFTEADAAVASVPTNFEYALFTNPADPYNSNYLNRIGIVGSCGSFGVADRDGGTGLNFVSGNDPRVRVITTQGVTCDKQRGYSSDPLLFPDEFGFPVQSMPLASGVEARLIQAEAALHAGQPGTWAADLNTLRSNAPGTFLHLSSPIPALSNDSTTLANSDMQVDVTFRERAFWLFGTGVRLGDMRRLLRQYGRTAAEVYPTGTYHGGSVSTVPTYGTDVDFTLPLPSTVTNPNYKGCLVPTTVG